MGYPVKRDSSFLFKVKVDDLADNPQGVEARQRLMPLLGRMAVSRISKIIVLFVLATMSIQFGAIQAWVWSFYTGVIYLAFLVFAWDNWRVGSGAGLSLNGYSAALGLFFGLALLACLPMSGGLLGFISPKRHQLLIRVEVLTDLNVIWPTLSYAPFHSLAWWAFLLGLVVLFIQMQACFSSRRMLVWSLWTLLVLAAAQGGYGIIQTLVPNIGVLWASYLKSGLGDARGTWSDRNQFAGFMGMMLPLLLGFGV